MVAMAVVIIVLFVILIAIASCNVASKADDEAEGFIMKPSVTPKPKAEIVYPVPLERELQAYIVSESEAKGIDPCIIFAQIAIESNYQADAIGDNGNSYGLMQIYKAVHLDRMERLGVDDLLDPYQNVTVGIDIMSELLGWNKGLDYALSYYTGMGGADCAYSRLVQERAEQIDEGVMMG